LHASKEADAKKKMAVYIVAAGFIFKYLTNIVIFEREGIR